MTTPPEGQPENPARERLQGKDVEGLEAEARAAETISRADRGDPSLFGEPGNLLLPDQAAKQVGFSPRHDGAGETGRGLVGPDSLGSLPPVAGGGDAKAGFGSDPRATIEIRIRSVRPDRVTVKAKGILAAPRVPEVDPKKVDPQKLEDLTMKLEDLTIAVLRIGQDSPELLEEVTAAVVRDPEDSEDLSGLMAKAERFLNVAHPIVARLEAEQANEPDRFPQPLMLLVLAGACLLGGGVAIPIVWGAKMELAYTNAVAAASLVCAGAALAKKPDA